MAKLYITAMVAAGLACFGYGVAQWTCRDPFSYLCLLGLALGTSLFKVTVPDRLTTLSVSFILVLLSIIDFSYPETLVVACLAAAVQAVWHKNHQSAVQFLFNLSSVAIAASVGYVVYHGLDNTLSVVTSIAIAAIAYFLTNTFAISTVIGLTSGSSIYRTWHDCHFWLFPYYLVGAGIALLSSWAKRRFGWEISVLALPTAYILFRSYRLYLERLGREKCHAEQMAELHLKTVEALAMAIEAKDATTHAHGRLKILDQAKRDFLSLISHELRTPLNGLLGVGDLLLADTGPHSELHDMFDQSRRRILSIVDDALVLSQIDVEPERFVSERLPVARVLSRAIANAEEVARSRNVNLEPPPPASIFILGMDELLVKAMQSLLETAVKFSAADGWVRLQYRLFPDSVQVVLDVCGGTVPSPVIPRFFEVLSVGEAVTADGDFGLGPAVAHRILALFGGSVSLENRDLAGIRLTVELQRAESGMIYEETVTSNLVAQRG